MLTNVQIHNLALIKEAKIEFSKGLNVLTGETGAGKSILIGAINIALGEKANKSMIRKDAEQGSVELLFTNGHRILKSILAANDLDAEEENLIITRKITQDVSSSKVNGQNVTLSSLRQITSLLVDIHGQHDHQSLLDPEKHMDILDDFGGDDVAVIKKEVKEEHAHYRQLRIRYKEFDKTEEDLKTELELLEYEAGEIDDAALLEREDEKLEEEYKKLSNAEHIIDLLNKVNAAFSSEQGSVTDSISASLKSVKEALKLDPGLQPIHDAVLDLESVSKDIGRDIGHYISENSFDAERFAVIRNRLDKINRLKSKYGNSLQDIAAYRQEISAKQETFQHYFDDKSALERQIYESGLKLNELSAFLSEKRKAAAADLAPAIVQNLQDLNFLDCRFEIRIDKLDRITDNGYDRMEFLFSSNPGEPLRPLAKVASGGELSRIMLAIKSALASKDEIDTLIFDEIDTGISGKTAQKVAEKLYDLSKSHQIICISHLPQIAAMAEHHYHIHKEVEDGSTISGIEKLNEDQMIYEIAKLVGGAEITPAALENARDLKGRANFFKRKLT